MSRHAARIGIFLLLAALVAARHDVWFWARSDRAFGLPIGLAYHLFYCFVVAGAMAVLVRFAWPRTSDEDRT